MFGICANVLTESEQLFYLFFFFSLTKPLKDVVNPVVSSDVIMNTTCLILIAFQIVLVSVCKNNIMSSFTTNILYDEKYEMNFVLS